ncbi:MAG: ABC transporter substrate-binding protein [Candidatus Omnitrophica bacterium]|nr:ABC transporter substrate-binding protein [Candidatus Omnitrophota bacterium]
MIQQMYHYLRRLTFGVVCFLMWAGFSAGADGTRNQTPDQAVKTFLKTVSSMEFPAIDPVRHVELVRQAHAYLDLETMGSQALADHWAGVSTEERQVFFDLLWKLVETVAYPKNRNLIGNEKIIYGETVQAGDGFQVPVNVQTEDEAPAVSMSYHLSEKEGRWKIDDMVLDDVSIIEDLKYQFDKIIAESEFPGLLESMRRRLAESKVKTKNEKV